MISFQAEYPTPGRYRLFLQFKHSGVVRTAAFTQEVPGVSETAAKKRDASAHVGEATAHE